LGVLGFWGFGVLGFWGFGACIERRESLQNPKTPNPQNPKTPTPPTTILINKRMGHLCETEPDHHLQRQNTYLLE